MYHFNSQWFWYLVGFLLHKLLKEKYISTSRWFFFAFNGKILELKWVHGSVLYLVPDKPILHFYLMAFWLTMFRHMLDSMCYYRCVRNIFIYKKYIWTPRNPTLRCKTLFYFFYSRVQWPTHVAKFCMATKTVSML